MIESIKIHWSRPACLPKVDADATGRFGAIHINTLSWLLEREILQLFPLAVEYFDIAVSSCYCGFASR